MVPGVSQTQVLLQLSGTLDLRLNTDGRERRYHTAPGTLYLTSAHQPDYEMAWISTSSEPVSFLEVCLDNNLLEQMAAADLGLDAARLELRDGTGLEDPLLAQLCRVIGQDLDRPECQTELYVDTAARMLAMQLVRGHSVVRPHAQPVYLPSLPRGAMSRVRDYVWGHLGNPITLAELSAAAGLSPYYFCRVFRRTTGQSPNAYVIAQRLAHGAHLLRHTRLSIAQVAGRVGYNNERHFARLFRRRFGCSPAVWVKDWLR